ncbi:Glutamate receptor U1-like 5, partial [Homarus americanus]
EVWITIIVCTPVLGLILWLLQKAWSWALAERDVSLVPPLFHTWGILLSEPSPTLPTKASGRVLMGWWLLTCVIITAAYRSSLVAHLSVQSKYPPINTFQDLLNRDGWSWGIYELVGTNFLYFNGSSDPDIQGIYQHMKNLENSDAEEWLERVLYGGFSLLDLKTWTQIQVAKRYTDKHGNTPFHIGTTEYPVFGGNISKMKQRLVEAGLLSLWLDELIKKEIKQNNTEEGKERPLYTEQESGQVVLTLDHLQGAFYLSLLGCCLAFGTFLIEIFIHYYYKKEQSFDTTDGHAIM